MNILFQSNIQASDNLISHLESGKNKPIFIDLMHFEKNLKQKKDLALPLQEELSLLNQLAQFELGRFLLSNKGLNGYWTSYVILHGLKKQNLSALEQWLLEEAPVVKATRERFYIFQKILQNNLKENIKIASIPCGLMDDLLALNYEQVKQFSLTGIDLDEKSLKLAQKNALEYNIKAEFWRLDAWALNIDEKFDVITSNGLNIYQADNNKVIELYKQFYKALTPGGLLITSFLTPPPALNKASAWKNVNLENAKKQKAIFGDIIGAAWQVFHTEAELTKQLTQAGFTVLEVIYDSQGMFPTILAKKFN